MNDPWNPSWDEIERWAYSHDATTPSQDWDLAVSWATHYARDIAKLASDNSCPKHSFFLHVLYLMVGDAVRRGRPNSETEAILERTVGMEDPTIAVWRERSRALLEDPETFDYEAWCGGGLASTA